MVRKFLLKLLWIYQKFFTLIGFGSCRYYPTCSEYARIHLEVVDITQLVVNMQEFILKITQFQVLFTTLLLEYFVVINYLMGGLSIHYSINSHKNPQS